MSQRCETCGTPLHTTGDSSDCPVCLLKTALEPAPSEQAISDSAATGDFKPPEPIQLQSGDQFGGYEIVRRLGRGGMGIVYEAIQDETGRRVALKLLTRSHDSGEARARFLREGRLAASVNHPNSVYVFGTEQIDETPAISMEYVNGGTLYEQVKTSGPLPVIEAVDAILQVIDGLEAAERKGVLHRDIKPSNCFVDASGNVKIGDYGLSISTPASGRSSGETQTNVTLEGTFLGTPAFSSPEQLRGEELDGRSDIYSIGATLFYLLTATTPFAGENMVQLLATVLDTDPPMVSNLRREVPDVLADVIAKCLTKAPGKRFRSYDKLRESLLPFSSGQAQPAGLMGLRVLASIVDSTCIWIFFATAAVLTGSTANFSFLTIRGWYQILLHILIAISYFTLTESLWGQGLGKRLVGIRVARRGARVGLMRCAIRAAIYVVPPLAMFFFVEAVGVRFEMVLEPTAWMMVKVWSTQLFATAGYGLVRAATFQRARPENSYAGLHELATDTQVVANARSNSQSIVAPDNFADFDKEQTVGPYHLLEELPFQPKLASHSECETVEKLWLAFDPKLLRRVWLHQRAPGHDPVSTRDREIGRATRLRWLGGQRTNDQAWDCYEANRGTPLMEQMDNRPWQVRQSLLADLAQELSAAQADGSLPDELSLTHLWVTTDNRLKLLPFPAPTSQPKNGYQQTIVPVQDNPERACVRFLGLVSKMLSVGRNECPSPDEISLVPVSARESLLTINESLDLEEAVAKVENTCTSTMSCHARRIGLAAIYVAIPMAMVLLSLLSWLDWMRMDSSHPEIAELAKLTGVARIAGDDVSQDDLGQVQYLMATRYGHVTNDDSLWNSDYAISNLPFGDRASVEEAVELFGDKPPNPERIKDAEAALDRIVAGFQASNPNMTVADVRTVSMDPIMTFAFTTPQFLFVFWVPSLIAAALFRRGLLLRLFGLQVVDKHGKPATRWQATRRVLVQGILYVPLFAVSWIFINGGWGLLAFYISSIALAIALLSLAWFSVRHPQRNLSDRIAGTYLAIE